MKYSRIKGSFSEARRIPLLGRIRLGIKVQSQRNADVTYPKETDFFVCPPEVVEIYGPEPKELDIMLPSENVEQIFPQNLAWFGQTAGLKCTGDGVEAERKDEKGNWVKRACPCEHYKTTNEDLIQAGKGNPKGDCTEAGNLVFLLPKVSMGGTYQIRTGSYHSVVDINSGIDLVRMLVGRVSMVPLKLKRVERETHNDGKRQVHYTMTLTLDAPLGSLPALQNDNTRIMESARLIQIEGPKAIDPENDGLPADRVEIEEAEVVDPNKGRMEEGQAALRKDQGRPETPAPAPVREAAPTAPAPAKVTTEFELNIPLRQLNQTDEGRDLAARLLKNYAVVYNYTNSEIDVPKDNWPEPAEARRLLLEALWEGVGDMNRKKPKGKTKR